MAGNQLDAEMERETEQIEDRLFNEYWPSGLRSNPVSTAASEVDEDASRADKTRKLQDGNKGENRGKGPGRKSQGQDPWATWSGRPQRGWEGWDSNDNQSKSKDELAAELKELRECMFHLQKLSLRHEDMLGAIRSEIGYVIFMRMGIPASIVPAVFQAQQAWREQKESAPETVTKPKRVALLTCIFREFSARLEKLPQQANTIDNLKKLGWISTDPLKWNYVKWDAKAERLKHDESREPITYEEGCATVAAIQVLVSKTGPVTRFHPNRAVEENMKGDNITFSVQLAMFGEEVQQLREHMLFKLSGNAITQIMAMSWRPERSDRSQLAKEVQRSIMAPK
eukprot:s4608_g12.t1